MRRAPMNTTELIIQSLIDIGQTIEFAPADQGKMSVSINSKPAQITASNFPQLNELFLSHYFQLGIEAEHRIDNGCSDKWHTEVDTKMPICPSCNEQAYRVAK